MGEPVGPFPGSEGPLPEQLIDRAIAAVHHQQADEFEICRDLLVAGPGGAVGVQVVNRALLSSLVGEVEHAWRRGWQPSELVRAARREGGARHARLVADACAAQIRAYPIASVDRTWKAQLEAVEADVWWTHDDHFVDVWAVRHGVDRAAAITTAIEVLHLLLSMPAVEPIGPMPGVVDTVAANGHLDQRLLDRVRALLAKAERTEFPEEAEAYTAKAQELMTRHRIDHALLAATAGKRDRPSSVRIAVDNPYEAAKSLLLQVVADANSCRAVWMKRFGLVAVVGYASDLDATEVLFTSLLVQATRVMTGAGSKTDRSGRNTTRSFRQSFLTSYASRIGERLNAASERIGQEAAASDRGAALVPVLAARTEAVNDAFSEQFPEMTQVPTHVNNSEGWASGRAAADRAVLQGRAKLSG
ncbi:DUF2786 domain-containing protein [Actinoplanes sp. TBRC 11911]|uniref:DUF2786 domain-containing protein n=1 Tax=Actinoplanes sp. TBRC 11911 TaxID=2729386 RepID=UPI0020071BC8|nr:DUF2786 domain-containing protein [Actinoplanes sp. TBRC 11911]